MAENNKWAKKSCDLTWCALWLIDQFLKIKWPLSNNWGAWSDLEIDHRNSNIYKLHMLEHDPWFVVTKILLTMVHVADLLTTISSRSTGDSQCCMHTSVAQITWLLQVEFHKWIMQQLVNMSQRFPRKSGCFPANPPPTPMTLWPWKTPKLQ